MAQEKQFEPTQSRIDRAKRDGDFARSQELANVACFAAAAMALGAVVPPMGAAARAALIAGASGRIDASHAASVAWLMLVPALAGACGALTAGVLQSGGLRFCAVGIKLERLSAVENAKRMFSRESLVTAARASIAFACCGAAILPAIAAVYAAALHSADVRAVAAASWSGALHAAAVACAIGAVFAGADYGLQLVRWRTRLRMSFEDLKRDRKEQDGDPLARSRRRALHTQLSRGTLRRVKDAAFIITNPTHIAIALEYRPPDVPVPRVLVRAAEEAAARVREIAAEYRIPVVENVALARALYAGSKAGEFIAQETYVAVAQVVAALADSGALTS